MIKMELKRIAFESQKIIAKSQRMQKTVLMRIGGFMRKAARQQIKVRKKASQAGSPPHTRGDKVLKNAIRFSATENNVLIGPSSNWIGDIGAVHEFGGTRVNRKDTGAMKPYSIGQKGLISSRRYKGSSGNYIRDASGNIMRDPLGGNVIVLTLTSASMVAHAERLRSRLNRGKIKQTYPKRPFMGPTLEENQDKILDFFRGTLTR